MKKSFFLLLLCMLSSFMSHAEVKEIFKGDRYTAEITSYCEEGDVYCDNVVLNSKINKTGKAVYLKGKTINTNCPGTCDFRGYQFKNGDYTYSLLTDNQELNKWNYIIMKGDKIISKDYGVIE